MSLLPNEKMTIRREGSGGSYEKGHRVSAADNLLKAEGSIQPLNGKEVLQLPESDRIRQSVKIYSAFAFQTNDIVVRMSDNAEFEVQKVENWCVFNMLQHYRVTAFLRDAQ